jgi:hypothetical protein
MNSLIITTSGVILVPRSLHERTQVIQRDAPVDLGERSLDDVLHVRGAQRATSIQRKQMPPRLRREPATLVGTQDPKVHK